MVVPLLCIVLVADLLVDPVVGKCGHDFCKACLDDWRHKQHTGIRAGQGRQTTCPVCRKDVGVSNSPYGPPDELGKQQGPNQAGRYEDVVWCVHGWVGGQRSWGQHTNTHGFE